MLPTATASTNPWIAAKPGKTWALGDTYHIGRIVIHPRNPDIVFVAALGHLFGPNDERGVYRSKDGGKTWQQVLYRDRRYRRGGLGHGPSNPSLHLRHPLAGPPQALDLSKAAAPAAACFNPPTAAIPGPKSPATTACPRASLGRIGVAISPANPERVWAMVEAADGGVYRSDDGGKKWQKTNSENNLRQRAWYYSHIFADPKSADTVYVLNTSMWKSVDGGHTFSMIRSAARRPSRPLDRA